MTHLNEGSFFGDYNILFDIFSSVTYLAQTDSEDHLVMVYKIDHLALLNCVVQDCESFKHFFKMSLSKMRHHQFMKTQIDAEEKKRHLEQ